MSAKVFHIPFIKALPELYTLHGVLQRSPTETNSAAKDHAGITVYSNLESLLADSAVDLVIVGSTPADHFAQCTAALRAGKHVLCEKPFVPTSAEAKELDKTAKEAGRVLAVFQNRRWDSDFVLLKEVLAEGKLGRLTEIESHYDRHRPHASALPNTWKAAPNLPAGGAIFDLGTHLLDQIVTLFGPPARITAFIANQRVYNGHPAEHMGGDSFTALLHYSTGLLCTVKAAIISPEAKQLRFWVRGEKGSFKKFNLDPQELQLIAGMRPGDEGYGIEKKESYGTLTLWDEANNKFEEETVEPVSPPKTYLPLFQELAAAIKGEGPVPVTPAQAAITLRVIELAKESSATGKTVDYTE